MSTYDDSLRPDEQPDPGSDEPLDPEAREIQEALDEHRTSTDEPGPEPGEERAAADGEDDPDGPGRGGD